MAKITDEEFAAANQLGQELLNSGQCVVKAYYHAEAKRLVVTLRDGSIHLYNPLDIQDLETTNADVLSEIEISPLGQGLHFPKIDADIFVPGLLQGNFGTKKWMAARKNNAQHSNDNGIAKLIPSFA